VPEIDPLASVGCSEVFFQLLLGRKTPKEISERLRTSPPTVVVRLGRKEGKFQPYEVDWEGFAREVLRRAYTPGILERLEPGRVGRLREILERLGKEEAFLELLRSYFSGLAEEMEEGRYPRRTVWGALYSLEESLDEATRVRAGGGAGRLIKLLGEWAELRRVADEHGPRVLLRKCLQELSGRD
jgi:hypothetical protein